MKPIRVLKNQSGIITVDFIFALIIVGAFFSIMFSLSLTLSVVEITQYVTFATARNYYAGHWSPEEQKAAGALKYKDITDNEVLKPLFTNGWFELKAESGGIGDYNNIYNQSEDSANFIGSRVELNAKVLEFRFPIIGSTYDDKGSFKANVGSYLNREPTSVECLNFMREENRLSAIKALDSSYGSAAMDDYKIIADNGC